MEERAGWNDAFSKAWNNLTGVNNEGNIKTIRLVFFLLFMLGTAWAGYKYVQGMELLDFDQMEPNAGSSPAPADKQRLDSMKNQVEMTSLLRQRSPEMVELLATNVTRYPFGDPMLEPPPPPVSSDVVIPPTWEELLPIVDYPPEGITLKAIMIMGDQRVAIMDIPGVGVGMKVKVGDTFMQKKGRVVRIAPDKVVVNWGGKNWDIAPSF